MWDGVATSIGSFFGYSLAGMIPARLRCVFEGHAMPLKLHVHEQATCQTCGQIITPIVQTPAEAWRVLFRVRAMDEIDEYADWSERLR